MSATQRRYLILEQGLGGGVLNFFLNAAIAWAMFRGMETVPLWGAQSIMGDTVGTSFILPFLTCLIGTPLVRRHMRAGRVEALGAASSWHPSVGWLPASTVRRGLVLGLAGVVLLAPLGFLALHVAGAGELGLTHFVLFKAGFAAVAAALMGPVVAFVALAERVRAQPATLPFPSPSRH